MEQLTWALVILGALLLGFFFERLVKVIIRFTKFGFAGFRKREQSSVDIARNSKVIASLSILTLLSMILWLAGYLVKQQDPESVWVAVTNAIFGVTTAGLLGGVIFELLLRRELMSEVSNTLANIITTDKKISSEIFTQEKRNEIIRTMLQLNSGSDLYGDAIFSDFLSRFIDPATRQFREFRTSFLDEIKFWIPEPADNIPDKYYIVHEHISYKAELKPGDFLIGCACNEEQLYSLFSEPNCIYRWLLKADDFDRLMTQNQGFMAALSIDGIPCQPLNHGGEIGKDGFQIKFQNPFLAADATAEMKEKIGKVVEYDIHTKALHDRNDRVLSVHLVYPVKGVEIFFDYQKTDIKDVIALHFLSPGMKKSKGGGEIRGNDQEPIFAPRHRQLHVKVPDRTWLFPDSGIIVVW